MEIKLSHLAALFLALAGSLLTAATGYVLGLNQYLWAALLTAAVPFAQLPTLHWYITAATFRERLILTVYVAIGLAAGTALVSWYFMDVAAQTQ